MAHKKIPGLGKKPSKKELERRKRRQKEADIKTGRFRGGKEIGTKAFERQEKVQTERPPTIKPRETIQLNVKEQEVIKLGKLTPKEFERVEGIHQLKQIGKAALVGAGIGAGLFFAGGAIIAKIAGAKATSAAIQSGFVQQTRAGVAPGLRVFGGKLDSATRALINEAASIIEKIPKTVPREATQKTFQLGKMAINVKTIGLTKNLLGKIFSIRAMAFGGAWASSVFLGRWGQAEAPEGIMIPIRDLIKIAETPEDWEIIDEHLTLAAEISKTSIWEEIILWSPFSAVKGIMSKVRGVAAGVAILKETAEQVQEIQIKEQETGETEFARERRETDEEAIERKKIEEERQDIRFEEIEEGRIARQDEEDRRAVIMQEVWRLRRESRFSEADELELTIIG